MRLTKLKLSGFKSFVDPTTVYFPSDLVGIVGPNGCGKSNTIDAVRWVMGESSAKNLRGESMTDVIFNGSTARKPVGQASVELVFDNSDGSLGGAYASYAEIAVKRLVTRDGQSNYYLNGTRCRRRDITDIFLGTGLGPRSYSIIEQGMISRLIEAKPDELRVYLEEVSGISKYKERRKETQQRINHTRENLERLNDLRDELGRQLTKLDAQAQAALAYQNLKSSQYTLELQLKVMHWQALDNDIVIRHNALQEGEILVEKQQADLYATDAALEEQRVLYDDVNQQFQVVQGQFYSLGADIARIEQAIKHQQERNLQLLQDNEQNQRQYEIAEVQLERDEAAELSLQEELTLLQPQQEELQAIYDDVLHLLESHEEAMRQWQHDWDEFNQQASQTTQHLTRYQSDIAHWEQAMQNLEQRKTRLLEEQQSLQDHELPRNLAIVEQQLFELDARVNEKEESLANNSSQMQAQRQRNQQIDSALSNIREQLQQSRGQYASVNALQQAALEPHESHVAQWLSQHHLADKPRLAQVLRVDSGWEHAVEVVLEDYLQAICIDGLENVKHALQDAPTEAITLVSKPQDATGFSATNALTPLSSKVQNDHNLLHGIYCVDTIASAFAALAQLQAQESIVTPEGVWLGKHWLRLGKVADEKSGIFAREKLLATLTEQMATQEAQVDQLIAESEDGLHQLRELEQARDALTQEITQWRRQYAELVAQQKAQQTRIEQLSERRLVIEKDVSDIGQQGTSLQYKIKETRTQLEAAVEHMASQTQKREYLSQLREKNRQEMTESKAKAHFHKEQLTQSQIRLTSVQAQQQGLHNNIVRAKQQLQELLQRAQSLQLSLAQLDDPLTHSKQQLENLLEARLQEEQKLQQSREKMEQAQQQLRQLEQRRQAIEQQSHESRRQLEALRLHHQSQVVRKETLEEGLLELQQKPDVLDDDHEQETPQAVVSLESFIKEVIATLPTDAQIRDWEQELQSIQQQISRLGAINLAAIDEFKQQSERKLYLDQQNDDLLAALTTLESAIEKIDAQTRDCFQQTFDAINASMKELFPRMFGGGEAYLQLVGDELLDAGVSVIARPPGKKNSSIHLLSGGEKALTAVALVFALFRLNPAPFCMLDEVDAPLDEANVGRFCRLVEEMSKTVQFIFITHNKVTMQLAKHLVGVTMREAGVSRLVSVDVDEAAEMALA